MYDFSVDDDAFLQQMSDNFASIITITKLVMDSPSGFQKWICDLEQKAKEKFHDEAK